MDTRICIAIITITGGLATAQPLGDRELAQMLSHEGTRQAAVDNIVAAGRARVPVLLSWYRTPPPGVERVGLYVGMATAFGALKTKESIPFLIEHISIQDWISGPDVWTKTAAVVESRLPAVKALIQIGSDSAKALMSAKWNCMSYEDRLASLLVISRVGEGTEVRDFLTRALGEASLERDWAGDALKALDQRTPPPR